MVPSREGGRGEGKPSPLIYEGSINFDLGSTDFWSFFAPILGSFWLHFGVILEGQIGHFWHRFFFKNVFFDVKTCA